MSGNPLDQNESPYREGVHSTVQGNIVLAKLLSSAVAQLAVPAHAAAK